MRRNLQSVSVMPVWLLLLAVVNAPATAQVTLYDNTDFVLGELERLAHPHEAAVLAQPFRTDERHTTITSATLPIGRFGTPEGELRVSIWDQQNGFPGKLVSEIGTITDFESLSLAEAGQPVLDSVTFTKRVAGLEANSTYYLHLDLTNAVSTPVGEGLMNHVVNGAPRSSDGTNEAGSLLTVVRGTTEWLDVGEFVGEPRYLQMSINAVPEPSSGVVAGICLLAIAALFWRRRVWSRTQGPDGPGGTTLHRITRCTFTSSARYGVIFSVIAVVMAASDKASYGQDIVYDNTEFMLNVGERIHPVERPGFEAFGAAQPFNIGDHDTVSSVTVPMSRWGSPEGTIAFSIWDDNGEGVPGRKVGDVGTLNASQLDNLGDPVNLHMLPPQTFDTHITGLVPQENYFLVEDISDLDVGRLLGEGRTIVNGGRLDSQGTNGAAEWLAKISGEWMTGGQLGLGARWLQMSVEAVSEAGLSGDYDGSGTVEQADLDLVLLNWGNDGTTVPAGWELDFPEGTIDQQELDKVLLNWGNSSAAVVQAAGPAGVPEPSGMVLALLALSVVLISSRGPAHRR